MMLEDMIQEFGDKRWRSRRWAKYDQTTLSEIFNKLIKIFAANRNVWYPIQETILKETVSFTPVQILQ